jgi:hypothetical protein
VEDRFGLAINLELVFTADTLSEIGKSASSPG